MTRPPTFEVVRTDAGWHARFRAANGQVVWTTEVYTRRRAAVRAVGLLSHYYWSGAQSPACDVDERGAKKTITEWWLSTDMIGKPGSPKEAGPFTTRDDAFTARVALERRGANLSVFETQREASA